MISMRSSKDVIHVGSLVTILIISKTAISVHFVHHNPRFCFFHI